MTTNNTGPDPLAVVLGPCVLSYPNLFVPRENKGDGGEVKMQYDADLLLYNEGANQSVFAANWEKLNRAAFAAAQELFGQMAQAVLQTAKNPWFQDLNIKKQLGKWDGPSGIAIRAKSGRKPEIVKRDPNSPPNAPVLIAVTDPEEVYAGMIVLAGIRAKPYKHTSGNQGVGWWLNHILIVSDGEPLGEARPPASAIFDASVLAQVAGMPVPQSSTQALMNAGGQMFGAPPQTYGQPPAQYGQPAMPPQAQAMVDNVMGFAPQMPPQMPPQGMMPPGFGAPQMPPGMMPQPGMPPGFSAPPQGAGMMPPNPGSPPGYQQTPQMPGGAPGVRY